MNPAFLRSLGIAAMDGLLCSFVAVLALAFFLQRDNARPAGIMDSGLLVLAVDKQSAVSGSSLTNSALSVSICRPVSCSSPRYRSLSPDVLPAEEPCGSRWPEDFEGMARSKEREGPCTVRARWVDCAAVDRACTGYLLINGLPRSAHYEIRFLVTNANNSEFSLPGYLSLAIRMIDGHDLKGIPLDSQRLRPGDPLGATLSVDVSPGGIIQARWLEQHDTTPAVSLSH